MSIDGTTIPHTDPHLPRLPKHRKLKEWIRHYLIAKNKRGISLKFFRSYDRIYRCSVQPLLKSRGSQNGSTSNHRSNECKINGRMDNIDCRFSKLETTYRPQQKQLHHPQHRSQLITLYDDIKLTN